MYVSRAAKRFKGDELEVMLKIFRNNNQKKGITGLLLYDGMGTFIQLLEGSYDSVHDLYQKISSDTRHSRITLLSEARINERSFPDWKMGFKNISNININNISGFSKFLQEGDQVKYLQEQHHLAIELFYYFKKSIT